MNSKIISQKMIQHVFIRRFNWSTKQTTNIKLMDILPNEDSGQTPESCVKSTQYQYINVIIKFINFHQKWTIQSDTLQVRLLVRNTFYRVSYYFNLIILYNDIS